MMQWEWIILGLTMCTRVWYVSNPHNWWIIHPDEIFQTLAVAHSEYYGYGFRPYEYLPPTSSNHTPYIARAVRDNLDMFSLRSFILPKLLALALITSHNVCEDVPPFLVLKIIHALIASLLPFAAFKFAKSLTKSTQTSLLASVLVASSTHLFVFGTHTISESFLSPIILLNFSVILNEIPQLKPRKDKQNNEKLPHNQENCEGTDAKESTRWKELNFPNDAMHSEIYTRKASLELYDTNQNKKFDFGTENKFAAETRQIEQQTTHANVIKCDHLQVEPKVVFKLFATSMTIGLCFYIRPDTILLFCSTFVSIMIIFKLNLTNCKTLVTISSVGIMFGFLIGVCDDVYSYRTLVISPWQWFKFNILSKKGSAIFGEHQWYFYFVQVYKNEPLNAILFLISLPIFILMLYSKPVHPGPLVRAAKASLFSSLLFLVIHCFNMHKESRFIHNFFVLELLFCSIIASLCWTTCKHYIPYNLRLAVVTGGLAVFVSIQFANIPSLSSERSNWSFKKIGDSADVNECLNYISQQNDVRGVFLNKYFFMSGSHVLLNKDVPIIALLHREYFVFDRSSAYTVPSALLKNKEIIVNSDRNSSDFISIYHTQYLNKYLLENNIYNYLVLQHDAKFFEYQEVFRKGTTKVLKRIFNDKLLFNIASQLNWTRNIDILNYEANWLMTLAQNNKAIDRLLYSINVHKTNINAYRLLMYLYQTQRNNLAANSVYRQCKAHHMREECRAPPKRLMLHSEYEGHSLRSN